MSRNSGSLYTLAVKCRHCGEIVDEEFRRERAAENAPRSNPGVAAVLSFFIPGLGQIYQGHALTGLVWPVATLFGYAACFLPGFVLHLLCIFSAASAK